MTELDERLRADLHDLATDIDIPTLPTGPAYRATVARNRRNWLPAAAAAAALVVLAGLAVVVTHRPDGIPPAAGGPGVWPTRGSLASDSNLLDAAVQTWADAPLPAAEQPAHDVHALYAEHTVAGDLVVLTGVDPKGYRRILWLNTDPTSTSPFRHRLRIVADVLAPDGDNTALIGLYGWRPTPRPTNDYVVVAIGPPTAGDLQWANELHRWAPMQSSDGAGVAVVAAKGGLLNARVRAGHEGHGADVLGDIPLIMVQPTAVDYEGDPTPAAPNPHERCSGNVCTGSASVGSGGIISSKTSDEWTDIREAYLHSPDQPGTWDEFQPEAELMSESLHPPTNGYARAAAWSTLLSDDTGLYLDNYTIDGNSPRLILYVDRPEWYGGRLGLDVHPNASTAAVAAVVPSRKGQQLAVIAADNTVVRWRAAGGEWQELSVHHNVAVADVTGIDPTRIRYSVSSETGALLVHGRPATSAVS